MDPVLPSAVRTPTDAAALIDFWAVKASPRGRLVPRNLARRLG